MDGHYVFHSVVLRDASGPQEAYLHRLLDVNRHGTLLDRPGKPLPHVLEQAGRDPALLFDRAPAFYRHLATELKLPDPQPLPPSTPETLAFRFASAWLQLYSALDRSYLCQQGVDAELSVRTAYFAAFDAHPEVAALAAETRTDPERWHPAHQYFFNTGRTTGSSSIPIACIKTNGVVRTPDGEVFNIPQVYGASGRSIWRLSRSLGTTSSGQA
jgi:hypothetical protein